MRRPWLLPAVLTLFGLAACGSSQADEGKAAPAAEGVGLSRIGSFDQPLYVTAPPGDNSRVFVVEQPGRIRVVRNGNVRSEPFLDVSDEIACCGEQGLLSMAFAPDYATTGRFYVDYTNRAGDTRVVEYRAAVPDKADSSSARVVLRVNQPEANHNGGLVTFGPDGLLYVGLGDGGGGDDQHGSRGNGQNLGTLLGKILRIDPRASGGRAYTVPSSNPFTGKPGARSEIYLYGVRNPWRFSFDRSTGDLTIGDVGQDRQEEVTFFERGKGRGKNLGWRPFEGRLRNFDEPAPGAVSPQLVYGRDDGSCSVTGGYVVRDPRLSALQGRYVYGDYCAGRLYRVKLSRSGSLARRSLGVTVPQLTSFGEDAAGRLYAVSGDGPVYRLVAP
ncbi:MAG: PQQ-dependent sugar dehydrogenase [Solirubrobacteraceae bacterium]